MNDEDHRSNDAIRRQCEDPGDRRQKEGDMVVKQKKSDIEANYDLYRFGEVEVSDYEDGQGDGDQIQRQGFIGAMDKYVGG